MRTIRWLLSLTVCLYLLASLPACSTPIAILIDPSQSTPFTDGWGTSLAWWANEIGGWPPDKRQKIITMLFAPPPAGLGLTIARYDIGAGADAARPPIYSCPKTLRLGAQIPTFEPQPAVWDSTADSNQVQILQEAKQAGANTFEAFATSPPAWMTVSGCTSGNPGNPQVNQGAKCDQNTQDEYNNIEANDTSSYVSYLQQVVTQFATQGITFRTLEPFNEANCNDGGFVWSPKGCEPLCQEGANFSPDLEDTILNKLCASLQGTGTTVSAPDENKTDTTVATYRRYQHLSLPQCLTQINTHSYQGSSDSARGELETLAQQDHKRLWMSEYTTNNPLTLARAIATDLNEMHPAAWVYWQAVESLESGSGYGLIQAPYCSPNSDHTIASLNSPLCKQASSSPQVGTPTEQYSVMANYSMFIRPGYHLLDLPNSPDFTEEPDPSRLVEALDPTTHTLVLVATNDQTGAQPVTFDLSSFTQTSNQIQVYTTTPEKQVYQKNWSSTATLNNQQLSANLEPDSVTTFVIKGATVKTLASKGTTTSTAEPLTKVDWKNFTYTVNFPYSGGCNTGSPQTFTVKNGEAKQYNAAFQQPEVFDVGNPFFGDLTGDGRPEAVIPFTCSIADDTGIQVLVYTGDAAHPRLIGTLPDPVQRGGLDNVEAVNISQGMLQISGSGHSASAPLCCPDLYFTYSYRWNGTKFVLIKSESLSSPPAPNIGPPSFLATGHSS